MPRWPFWPASIGCLTLVISVTRSAASTSRGSARRPVITTCWRPGPVAQRLDDVVDVDPAPLHRVGELVEHVEVVGLGGEPALDLAPSPRRRRRRGRRRRRPCATTTSRRPSCATRPGRPRRSRSCSAPSRSSTVCSPIRHLADFTNWKTPIVPALVPAAQRQPERGGRLPLAVAGVHHQQRPVAALPGGEPVVGHDDRLVPAASGHPPRPVHGRGR